MLATPTRHTNTLPPPHNHTPNKQTVGCLGVQLCVLWLRVYVCLRARVSVPFWPRLHTHAQDSRVLCAGFCCCHCVCVCTVTTLFLAEAAIGDGRSMFGVRVRARRPLPSLVCCVCVLHSVQFARCPPPPSPPLAAVDGSTPQPRRSPRRTRVCHLWPAKLGDFLCVVRHNHVAC